MSNEHQSEHNWLDDLFLDDAADIFSRSGHSGIPENGQAIAPPRKFVYPALPAEDRLPEGQLKAYWKTLRAFFRTGKGGGLPAQEGRPAAVPALLAPYLFAQQAGSYPCWIDSETQPGAKPALFPLRSLIEQNIASFAPGDLEGKILKDNLLRLDFIIKKKIKGLETPRPAQPFLDEVLDELVLKLDLKGRESEAFLADVDQLRKLLPKHGTLIPFSPCAPFHLLAIQIDVQVKQQRVELKKTTAPLADRVRQLLLVEREKDPATHSAASLEANMDFAGSFLNFEELAALIPSGGSVAMPEERLHRLEHILQTLENAESTLFGQKPGVVIAKRLSTRSGIDLPALFPAANVEIVPDEKAFERITNLFDQKIQAFSAVFAAIRIARLELEERYQHDVHGDLFAHFTHSDFNEAELALCPPFIVAVHSAELTHFGLNDFSALLASNRPVKCLALKFDALGHVAPPDKSGRTEPVFRQEPAALAVAHRDTFVLQSAIADPVRLFDGFWAGLESPAPAFFYVLSSKPNRPAVGGGLVWNSSALNGREFPFFSFDNGRGLKWGSRFDISGNPKPELDWPEEILLYTDTEEISHSQPTPFTFADFAALDPDFGRFFNLVPAACWSDDLIPLADYLRLPETTAYSKVPFIWMVDAENRLQKAAVALPLVQTCLERLDFWHYLQENAGIHSFHVEQATERLNREFEAQMQQRMAELTETHAREIEQVREESARGAMERLADYLLDLDVSAMVPAASPVAPPVAVPTPKQEEAKTEAPAEKVVPAAKAAEEVKLELAEAWVETPLCTTCNECINLNDRIFKYNADKQAYIANAAGGPFADIVKAAENCPVSIIHPGAPLNPKEPGLDALVKRAAKFN